MIAHYLKIALRNLWKYKTQNIISIVGLAVGFTCFALATLWIRYEMTFDSFHKNANRMYAIYSPTTFNYTGDYSRISVYPLAAYLKETFPEIEDAISVAPAYPEITVKVEGVEIPALIISADSMFLRMFDVKILEGSRDFLIPGSNKFAITREKVRQLFGNENPIGKTISLWNNQLTICAVVSGIPKQSNYAFDFITSFDTYIMDASQKWSHSSGENTIIKLASGTNIKTFEKKLYEIKIEEFSKMKIMPLTKIHYTDPDVAREVKFQYIVIFAISGISVILCSLFNYLTLFVSRFRIRQKEFALRMVCGASGGSLFVMLTVEFMLTLLFAVLLGGMLTQWLYKPFLALSDIQMSLPAIYSESLMYIAGVIGVTLLVFWLILFFFRHRSLNISIRQGNKNLSRKISVIVQLVISISFAFCTIVILKQIYFLHHTSELGFSFQNRGVVFMWSPTTMAGNRDNGVLVNLLKQVPEITDVIDAEGLDVLLPQNIRRSTVIFSWDDKPANIEKTGFEQVYSSPECIAFYCFRLVAGEMLTDADPDSLVLINESAVKAFGWHNPLGKHFDKYTVKGVIKNIYNVAPTVETKPAIYLIPAQAMREFNISALFKYKEGMWKPCKEKIEQLLKKKYADYKYTVSNSEEVYDEYLKSENALIKLLSFVSVVCVLICVFGFVSLISLTCEERRKSIAIRKINGATVGNILAIFAKEYFLLLTVGAAIAFSAGYFIIHRWLENYVKQTSIPAWIYLMILFVLALVIVLCVGWQVYRASIENPAEVVKRE